jgi:hypothetical protein
VLAIAEGVETPLPKLRLVLEESWPADNNIYVEVEHETTMADCVALIAARLNMSMQDLQVYIENYDDWEGSNYWPVDSLDTTTIWEHVKGSTFTIEYRDQIIHINYRTNAGQGGGDNGEGTVAGAPQGDNGPPTPPDSGAPEDGDTPQDGGTSPAGDGADGDTPQDGGTSPAGDGADESDDDEFANAWPVGSGFHNPNDLEFDPSLDLDEEPEGLTYNCDPDTNIIIKTITGKVDQQKFNMRASLAEIKTYVEKELLVPQEQQIIIIGRERVVDSFMKGGDKSHMNLEELGLENNSMIFLTYEMRGGGSKGVKKVIDKRGTAPAGAGARKKKTKPQDDDDDDDDEDEDSDQDDNMENTRDKASQLLKQLNTGIATVRGMQGGEDNNIFQTFQDKVAQFMQEMERGKKESLFLKEITNLPTPKLKELTALQSTCLRNYERVGNFLTSNYIFCEQVTVVKQIKDAAEMIIKLYSTMATIMFFLRYGGGRAKSTTRAMQDDIFTILEGRSMATPAVPGSMLGRLFRV